MRAILFTGGLRLYITEEHGRGRWGPDWIERVWRLEGGRICGAERTVRVRRDTRDGHYKRRRG
jgi:hypothetical protein